MNLLSPKARISIGLVGLTATLVLSASFVGLIPDRGQAVREGRASTAEVVAANSSVFVSQSDIRRMAANLKFVVTRNDDILSAAIRRSGGELMVEIGEHRDYWLPVAGDHSTASQVRVPIWAGQRKWGEVELRYRPLAAPGWRGFLDHPLVRLVVFVAVAGFVAFYFYLGRMLKHLDPSKAVPARVRSALDTMAEGLLVLDGRGQVALANSAFASMLDKPPDKLLGLAAASLPWAGTDGQPMATAELPWMRALESGLAQKNAIVRLQLGPERRHTFMTNCSPVLTGGGGRTGGVLVSFDDVTQLEEKEEQLRRARDDAEAANLAKSAFLANMSHEIRTPMNAILGFTEVLKRGYGRNPEDSQHYLDTIHSSGQHLLGLINDILDLSKVEAGRMELERTDCQPHFIAREVVQILGVKAREKNISLEFMPQGALPEQVESDPTRLRQILTNLVGNAIKFTEKGGVNVIMKLAPAGRAKALVIEVTDTGVGMPEDRVEAIFDAFVQADDSTTRRFGGTGLGLAISRKFAQALEGDIVARSALGEGSTFTVTLPVGELAGVRLLQPAELLTAAPETEESVCSRWVFPPKRVLVVDDGHENRELVTLVLEEAGLQVQGAEHGQEALERVAETPDLAAILMDVQMPVMDGFTATRLLREQGVEIPIVALTANAMKGYEEELKDKGFSAYMTKPVDIDRLIALLAGILGGRPEEAPANASVAERKEVTANNAVMKPHSTLAPIASPEGAPIFSRLPADNPKFRQLVERFVPRLHEQMETIRAAWADRDLGEVAALAHWLKGAGGTMGFDVLTAPAAELEQAAKTAREADVPALLETLEGLAARLAPPSFVDALPAVSAGAAPDPAAEFRVVGPVTSRLAGDPRLAPIVARFVVRLQAQMAAIEKALSRGDLAEVTSLAHWLKGAAGTVGFDVFTEPARRLHDEANAGNGHSLGPLVAHLRRLCDAIEPMPFEEVPERRAG